jgi:hypothetical protein
MRSGPVDNMRYLRVASLLWFLASPSWAATFGKVAPYRRPRFRSGVTAGVVSCTSQTSPRFYLPGRQYAAQNPAGGTGNNVERTSCEMTSRNLVASQCAEANTASKPRTARLVSTRDRGMPLKAVSDRHRAHTPVRRKEASRQRTMHRYLSGELRYSYADNDVRINSGGRSSRFAGKRRESTMTRSSPPDRRIRRTAHGRHHCVLPSRRRV